MTSTTTSSVPSREIDVGERGGPDIREPEFDGGRFGPFHHEAPEIVTAYADAVLGGFRQSGSDGALTDARGPRS
jgi:hypothetical protein